MRHLTEEHKRKIGLANSIKLKGRKHTIQEIQKIKQGMNKPEVKEKIRQNAIKERIYVEYLKQDIISLYNLGKNSRQISEIYPNFSVGLINSRLKKWKISIRNRSQSKIGNLNPMYKKQTSEKQKKAVSLFSKNRVWTDELKNKVRISNIGKKRSDLTKQRLKISRLRQITPFKDTSIELKMQKELIKRNIFFEKHKPILGVHQVDLFIEPNIIIECDGDYWHNYPYGTERDLMLTKKFTDNNYFIFRFWENEINNNCMNCVDKIDNLLKKVD